MSKAESKGGNSGKQAKVEDLKQASRDRDAALLASGKAAKGDLDRKNGFLAGLDFSRVKIVSVGDRQFEDID